MIFTMLLIVTASHALNSGTDGIFASGTGSRAFALAQAFTAAADDSSAVHYNPAGLLNMERQQISFLHYPMYADTVYNSITYGYNILDFGAVGAGFFRASTADIETYDENNFVSGILKYEEYRVVLSFARPVAENIYAGASLNVLNKSMGKVNATGFGADIGAIYEPFKNFRAGIMIRNFLKPSLQMTEEEEELPQTYAAGAYYGMALNMLKLGISADILKGENSGIGYGAGLEAGIFDAFFLRGGYSHLGPGFGAGLKAFGAEVDYAYVVDSELGGLSRFTLSYSFGMNLDQQKVARQNELKEQVKKLIEEEFRKKEQDKAKVYVEEARALYRKNNIDGALEQLDMALEWAKDYPEAIKLRNEISKPLVKGYYDSALSYYDRKDYVNALEMFRKVYDLNPSYAAVDVYMERVNNKLTVKTSAKKYFEQGLQDFVKKRYDDALDAFRLAKKEDPQSAVIASYISKAEARLKTKSSGRTAVTAEQRAQSRKLYQSGLKKYTEGALEEAVGLWKEALRINPDDVKIQKSIEKAQAEISELKKRGIK